MNLQSFATLTGVADSAAIVPAGYVEALERGIVDAIPYQITISGTATARIEGRISAAHEWVTIGASVTATAAGILSVAMPEMRLSCTAYTSGNVDAAILLP